MHGASEKPTAERRAGFILVEVLVAMAISAFLLVALASVSRLAFRAFERAQATSDRVETESRLFATLLNDLQRLPRWRWASDNGFVFAGGPAEIFYGETRLQADGGSRQIVVHLQNAMGPAGDATFLTRSEADFVPGMASFDDLTYSAPKLMSRQAGGIRFAYYERIEGDFDVLTDVWSKSDALPVAIRISATDEHGEAIGRAIRIPILMTAEPACALTGTQDCSLRATDPPSPGAPETGDAIDPNDPLGWMRYAQ